MKRVLINFAKLFRFVFAELIELTMIPILLIFSFATRFCRKKIDIGLGPEPLINYVYFKEALVAFGYTAETFVTASNYITDQYDVKFDTNNKAFNFAINPLRRVFVFMWMLGRYKALYTSFNGGPLGDTCGQSDFILLKRFEPILFKIANCKVLIMPFGGDVYTYDRCNSFEYKYYMRKDYKKNNTKRQQKRVNHNIDRWTDFADCILCGGDEAYYIPCIGDYYLPSYLSIDLSEFNSNPNINMEHEGPLVVVHATNHPSLKGTKFFKKAIDELIKEGCNIEFVCLKNVPGKVVREELKRADIVAGQLIIGMYGMFDLEAMAAGKPVLTYIDPRLIDFWEKIGCIESGELPLGTTTVSNVKEQISLLYHNRDLIQQIGKKSRQYVERHHSIEVIGKLFRTINEDMGLYSADNNI